MLHPIAYKDCKTQQDFAAYKTHCKQLDSAYSAAFELQTAIMASGLLHLLPKVNSLIDDIHAEKDAYTADEVAEIQSMFTCTRLYKVQPEYFSQWGSDVDEDTVITEDEVERLAAEWEKDVETLKQQLIEI